MKGNLKPEKLLCCPFCNEAPTVNTGNNQYVIRCIPCDVRMTDDRADKVQEKWNRRFDKSGNLLVIELQNLAKYFVDELPLYGNDEDGYWFITGFTRNDEPINEVQFINKFLAMKKVT